MKNGAHSVRGRPGVHLNSAQTRCVQPPDTQTATQTACCVSSSVASECAHVMCWTRPAGGTAETPDDTPASECWRPILNIEAIVVSVLSMLSDPNFNSPANMDASVRRRPLAQLADLSAWRGFELLTVV